MIRARGIVLIVAMFILSLVFLSWSGLLRFASSDGLSSSKFPPLQSLILNRKGNVQLEAQKYDEAFDAYVKTLELDPFSAETHLNLGLTFEGNQKAEKAMPSYKNALEYAKDDEMKFMAYFNQAQLLGKEKKVDEALELYQQALNINPTSKEAKTNIELLIQMKQQSGKDGDDKKDQENQDQSDQQKDQKNKEGSKDSQDQKEQESKDQGKDDKEQENKDKKESPKQYAPNSKHQPRPFKGEELSEGDVKKILGEIKQQEQKIRSEYNRKEVKEQPRDKDW